MTKRFRSETDLDETLSRPHDATIECLASLEGDLIILGVAGKMGMTLARMAARACEAAGLQQRVVGVARFSTPGSRETLESWGVETLRCDLLDRAAVAALPQIPNVVFMAGRKFGTGGMQALTWAMNTLVPAHVCEHFGDSRIAAFSTGCVYPLVSAETGGCDETTPPAPVGEYAQSCLGRERIFEHYSERNGTPVCLIRLNYAIDMRYGVLHDIGRAVWEERPVEASVGHVNVIWQGDANNQALRCLGLCDSPADVINITGPELLETRDLAARFGRAFDRPVSFTGTPCGRAYLNDASRARGLFGPPATPATDLVQFQADWIRHGGGSLDKPTHFQVSDGEF